MKKNNFKKIVLGSGCFWCIEAMFQKINGVKEVVSGYAGGNIENPNYQEVSGGRTGHAEVVKIIFDSDEISLEEILEIFFVMHDPTTLNRQGNDEGTQYRSIVLFTEKKQEKIINDYIEKINKDFEKPIVTEVKELENFYEAEDYHLNYYQDNKNASYCQVVISPKLKKLREKFNNKINEIQ